METFRGQRNSSAFKELPVLVAFPSNEFHIVLYYTHKNLPTGMIAWSTGGRHSFETNALSAEDTARHYRSSRDRATEGLHHSRTIRRYTAEINRMLLCQWAHNLLLSTACTLTRSFQYLLQPTRVDKLTNVLSFYVCPLSISRSYITGAFLQSHMDEKQYTSCVKLSFCIRPLYLIRHSRRVVLQNVKVLLPQQFYRVSN
jgi:hypothetical protein